MARITGFADLNKEDGDDKDNGKNNYYAGGASQGGGGSGLNVVGPPSDQDDMYAGLRAHASAESGDVNVKRVITLYREGFTVDDGDYRPFSDPTNAAFIDALNRGMVPEELQSEVTSTGEVPVAVKDKSSEDYVPPAYVAYSGAGMATGTSQAKEGALVSSAQEGDLPTVVLDDSKPMTTIAVRLHNGKRMRAKLNHHHTVRHLQALIHENGAGDVPYVLMAGFPPTQLTNFEQSVEQAGLCGSQVTQKAQ